MHDYVLIAATFCLAVCYLLPVARWSFSPGLWEELKSHVQIAVPSVLRFLFFTCSERIFIMLIGHMDATPVEHFDGAAMGVALTGITGLSVGLGFLGAMAPFVAQECGSGKPERCGLHLRNYYKCVAVIFAFSWTVATWADVIMQAMGQNADVAVCVQKFARIGVWSVPFQLTSKGIQQVLDAQADVFPGLTADVVTGLTQVPCTWMILHAGYGYQGAAVGRLVVHALGTTSLVAFVSLSGRAATVWQIAPTEASAPMLPFLQLAVPSAFATCIEWWVQEFMLISAGWLDHAKYTVAAQSILFQLAVTIYMVWVGAKNAMSVRVGNLIGAHKASMVPTCLFVGVAVSLTEVIAIVLAGLALRDRLIAVYTVNVFVHDHIVQAWPAMLSCFVPYSVTFVLFGVLSGAGRQSVVAGVFCLSCFFGLSFGTHLCFVAGLELEGLWFGNAVFFLVTSAVLYVMVLRMDWTATVSLNADVLNSHPKVCASFHPHLQELSEVCL
eukprot:TRINITY_DN38423_c0_g1_i1.p1 TRINITY_DN38423_c0_g1~~TRINITY_DN38423_c0_g1_i1.p1  ORF type:complete len:520 (+),score=46.93 TRINITY_DN38423_c0_g1_i1:67-1560(+)